MLSQGQFLVGWVGAHCFRDIQFETSIIVLAARIQMYAKSPFKPLIRFGPITDYQKYGPNP